MFDSYELAKNVSPRCWITKLETNMSLSMLSTTTRTQNFSLSKPPLQIFKLQ